MKLPRYILMGLVRAYQCTLSPLKSVLLGQGACCRFSPSCSCYAFDAFRYHGVFYGGFLTAKRLLKCHPWGGEGFDPVPALKGKSI